MKKVTNVEHIEQFMCDLLEVDADVQVGRYGFDENDVEIEAEVLWWSVEGHRMPLGSLPTQLEQELIEIAIDEWGFKNGH